MGEQAGDAVGDEVDGGGVPGEDEVEDQGDVLGGGEWVVVGGEQGGDEIVAGVGVVVVDEGVRGGDQCVEGVAQGSAGGAVGEDPAPGGPVRALGFGDADEFADDGDRQRVGEVGDQVDGTVLAGVGGEGVEEGVGEVFDAGAQPRDAAGGEGPDDSAA
ncbi:hypothetical protein [Streptomyces sp. NPDC020330]|uniref:hypothetical protein n=1 Tax=unclassified Streptomyces TaxID=2593676 RepID=UPI00379A4584